MIVFFCIFYFQDVFMALFGAIFLSLISLSVWGVGIIQSYYKELKYIEEVRQSKQQLEKMHNGAETPSIEKAGSSNNPVFETQQNNISIEINNSNYNFRLDSQPPLSRDQIRFFQ